jgi:hypothetical protein
MFRTDQNNMQVPPVFKYPPPLRVHVVIPQSPLRLHGVVLNGAQEDLYIFLCLYVRSEVFAAVKT